MTQRRADLVGIGFAAGSSFALGLAIALSRYAYDGGTNGLTIAILRAGLLLVAVTAICLLTRRRFRIARRDWWHCLGLGVLYSWMMYANVAAVQYIPVSLTALLFYTFPPMIALIYIVVLRMPPSPVRLACVVAAFVGLSLMLGTSFGAFDWRGIAMALTAAMATAWNAVWLSRRIGHLDTLVATAHMAWPALAVLTLLLFGFGEWRWPSGGAGWFGLLSVIGLQASGLPLYIAALTMIGALRCGMIANVQPLVSIAFAFALFDESLSLVQLLGGAIVLASIWVMQAADARRAAAAEAAEAAGAGRTGAP